MSLAPRSRRRKIGCRVQWTLRSSVTEKNTPNLGINKGTLFYFFQNRVRECVFTRACVRALACICGRVIGVRTLMVNAECTSISTHCVCVCVCVCVCLRKYMTTRQYRFFISLFMSTDYITHISDYLYYSRHQDVYPFRSRVHKPVLFSVIVFCAFCNLPECGVLF